MGYATPTDLVTSGLPSTALGNLTPAQQQAALDNASALADSYFRGRYALPLLAWGAEVTEAVCVIASYKAMVVRGFSPAAGADSNLETRYLATLDWLGRVQRSAAHPNVTPSAAQSPTYDQPFVITSSVIDSNGRTATTRGW
jgi:phage gp36-like protein